MGHIYVYYMVKNTSEILFELEGLSQTVSKIFRKFRKRRSSGFRHSDTAGITVVSKSSGLRLPQDRLNCYHEQELEGETCSRGIDAPFSREKGRSKGDEGIQEDPDIKDSSETGAQCIQRKASEKRSEDRP